MNVDGTGIISRCGERHDGNTNGCPSGYNSGGRVPRIRFGLLATAGDWADGYRCIDGDGHLSGLGGADDADGGDSGD